MKRRSIFGLIGMILLNGCGLRTEPATPFAMPVSTSTAIPPVAATKPMPTIERITPGEPVYLRLNQVGYLPGDSKVALALTNADLSDSTFQLGMESGTTFSGMVGRDRGAYGKFAHLYELDFSQLDRAGSYLLSLPGASMPVSINSTGYASLIPTSLQFFRVQRCGDNNPLGHAPCHLLDGVAVGGPADGERVDVAGGWHDAGDYIKFMITTGYVTNLMLTAYLRHPEVFANAQDPNATPAVLVEARTGLDWMYRMWDPGKDILYYQVSDASDHGTWRMPETDTNIRPVWPCEPGKGANVAGKAAAALALAAYIWNDDQQLFRDSGLASAYLKASREIYAWGQKRPLAQPSNPPDFYREESWQDDMALAAAELYRATGDVEYLAQAHQYASAAGEFTGLDWANMHALAHYEIARLDPDYAPTAQELLAVNLKTAQVNSDAQPFRAGINEFHWGSNETMVNFALEALWYEDLTGDTTYHLLAQKQRDFILGENPWGIRWVSGAGNNWPKFPHHQVADLAKIDLTGFWDEGAVPLEVFKSDGPEALAKPDIYADFQTDAAVYHDDPEDWVTNEPTITMNAAGLAIASWYAAEQKAHP